MALVGKKAPGFKSAAVINGDEIVDDFSLDQYLGKNYVVLFFYPKDYTFVCPTEIIAFQKAIAEFEKRDVQVIGCSTDSAETHWNWLQTPQEKGGIAGVKYPLVADTTKKISSSYDTLDGDYYYNEEGELDFEGEEGVPYRGLFLIDKEGIVHHQLINNKPLGRNVKETLRMVDALRHVEEKGEVCPAGWEEGQEAMKETHESVSEYLAKNQ